MQVTWMVQRFFLSNHASAANIVIPSNTTLAGINVPRRRFLPVKTCSDLLIIMSNLYEMKHGKLEMSHLRQFPTVPIVQLSGSHFKKVRGHSSRCLMFQSRPQSLRYPDPVKRATDDWCDPWCWPKRSQSLGTRLIMFRTCITQGARDFLWAVSCCGQVLITTVQRT